MKRIVFSLITVGAVIAALVFVAPLASASFVSATCPTPTPSPTQEPSPLPSPSEEPSPSPSPSAEPSPTESPSPTIALKSFLSASGPRICPTPAPRHTPKPPTTGVGSGATAFPWWLVVLMAASGLVVLTAILPAVRRRSDE